MYAFAHGDTSRTSAITPAAPDWAALAADIRRWGKALGFQEIGIADTDLDVAEQRLLDWLAAGTARRDGLYGTARRRPGAPRRARSGHAASHHRADELPPAGRRAPARRS
jgi:hypothetical protein